MTHGPNPYKPGTYEHQYYDDRVREIQSRQDHYEIVMGDAPEIQHATKLMTQRVVGEIEPSHGHIGIRAREDLRFREIRAAIAQESRGEMRDPDPEPEWRQVHADHPEAGRLRLRTDGTSWALHIRGSDLGCGPVWHGEITEAGLQPRPEIVEAAAARALADPWGPEAPAGSPIFRGGPDGEPVEITAADLNAAEPAELGVIERFRRRLTDRKGSSIHD